MKGHEYIWPSPHPRAPPDKPKGSNPYLLYEKNNTLASGISVVIEHPYSREGLLGYVIRLNYLEGLDGSHQLGHPMQFDVPFEKLYFDDLPIKIDIPLFEIYQTQKEKEPEERDLNPHYWLDQILKITVCSMPSNPDWSETGNCQSERNVGHIRKLPAFSNAKLKVDIAESCSIDMKKDPERDVNVENGTKHIQIIIAFLAVLCVAVLFALLACCCWKQIRDAQFIRTVVKLSGGRRASSNEEDDNSSSRGKVDRLSQWGSGSQLDNVLSQTAQPYHFSTSNFSKSMKSGDSMSYFNSFNDIQNQPNDLNPSDVHSFGQCNV